MVVVGDGFSVRGRSMTAVGCSDMRWGAAMRLFLLVVIMRTEEEDE